MKTKLIACGDCRGTGQIEQRGRVIKCSLCGGKGERHVVCDRADLQTKLLHAIQDAKFQSLMERMK